MLKKENIKKFEIEVIGDTSKDFVGALLPAMKTTMEAIFKDEVEPDPP